MNPRIAKALSVSWLFVSPVCGWVSTAAVPRGDAVLVNGQVEDRERLGSAHLALDVDLELWALADARFLYAALVPRKEALRGVELLLGTGADAFRLHVSTARATSIRPAAALPSRPWRAIGDSEWGESEVFVRCGNYGAEIWTGIRDTEET